MPVSSTTSRASGICGGTMRASRSVNAKCAMPPKKNQQNTNHIATRCQREPRRTGCDDSAETKGR